MRTLVQPGPVAPDRWVVAGGAPRELRFELRPGMTLHEAVTAPLVAAGFEAGSVAINGGAFSPFRYVRPGPPDGPAHVAYFTAPLAPEGVTQLERAALTFGFADGAPFLHCHAVWVEPDGAVRGGHILPKETVVVAPGLVTAWGLREARIETGFDAETNFTLFGVTGGGTGDALVARVRPNVDICGAVEDIARSAGWREATVRGSVGSLVGVRFADGREVEDYATEVLVRSGAVRDGRAVLDLAVADMAGNVHQGVLARGDNAVLITFDLLLTRGLDA